MAALGPDDVVVGSGPHRKRAGGHEVLDDEVVGSETFAPAGLVTVIVVAKVWPAVIVDDGAWLFVIARPGSTMLVPTVPVSARGRSNPSWYVSVAVFGRSAPRTLSSRRGPSR